MTRLRVTAGVIRQGDRILIARRAGHDPLAGKWEFPGGKIEPGEKPEDCLQRELLEELGITVRIGRFLESNCHDYPERRVELLFYEGEYVAGEVVPQIHDRFAWIEVQDLVDYDLAPADRPFARQLMKGSQKFSKPT
jgi:8-oxo-dGTP diphosphatase